MHNAIPAIPSAEVEADMAAHLGISLNPSGLWIPYSLHATYNLDKNHLPRTRLCTCATNPKVIMSEMLTHSEENHGTVKPPSYQCVKGRPHTNEQGEPAVSYR